MRTVYLNAQSNTPQIIYKLQRENVNFTMKPGGYPLNQIVNLNIHRDRDKLTIYQDAVH